jgi:hypothetical protein
MNSGSNAVKESEHTTAICVRLGSAVHFYSCGLAAIN